ncbi:phosphatidate cytidylyltransferase [Rothia sp. P6271]|uniref:phosphatidate cytidylyltransferase n=1 Tax=unclassified Rothia (in: high G+C Gram-positive bacteria) TaxID=2689056 RepID=UPI003ACCE559
MSARVKQQTGSKNSKAGRNLPAAIFVGTFLGALLIVGLFCYPWLLVILGALAAAVGTWEVTSGINKKRGMGIPMFPTVASALFLPLIAYIGGGQWMITAMVCAILAQIIWRLLGPKDGMIMSVMGSIFVTSWVPFMVALALLLFRTDGGSGKIFLILLMAVANDTWGYLAGVRWGKHPMAPTISPKKTWEGFAGSLIGSALTAVISCFFLGYPWWFGVILACALVVTATAGDLSESMIKREIGIKDMSNILPGHGGVMDRLDSIVFCLAVGYVLFTGFEFLV